MSSACTPILVGMAIPVSEILLLSKMAKFPLLTMDYSPWSSKNLIDRNQPKKFMQVGIDVKCMHTNIGGHGVSNSEILLLSKTVKFPFLTMDYSPWSSKNLIDRNRPKKFMQIGIDVKCMHTNFGGRGYSSFGDTATLKNGLFPLLTMDYYSPWSSKNLIDRNQPKKFMQVGIDVKCMHTNFSGCGLSSFGDIATFKNSQISLSDHGL